ncbi:MAG TPA: aminoglycoside 6-adenylyltransferase [Chitinophagaceae bacterium]|jgi:aminoglycoside 6-adenylyltransferase
MQKLEKMVGWANSKDEIRALILSGSLAGKGKTDKLSDYDIALYGTDFRFIEDDSWLNEIQNYWVCIHDQFQFLNHDIPTRLTIFDAYFKVDFSFFPITLLHEIGMKTLPDDYNIGYQILLDKDEVLIKMQHPSFEGFVINKPGEKSFRKNVNEFWFECYHVAKYLYRNELWTAKLRDMATKELLRQMLEWQEAGKRKWKLSAKNYGKEMQSWVNKNSWQALHYCFGKFDTQESWDALKNTIQLFRKAAIETARLLEYEYNEELDSHISQFIRDLENHV